MTVPDISPRAQAALGGLLLLGCLWLPWYTVDGDAASAWQTFTGLDYTLAVLAISAVAGAALSLRLKAWTIWTTISLGGGLAIVAIFARILYPPDNGGINLDPSIGPFIGLIGAIAILTSLGSAKRDWEQL
jgi:predicted membrane channel-forming protein YqfA (hemolysin III family)